jgi:hypothetical protein
MAKALDLVGQTFGEWLVLKRAANKICPGGYKQVMWQCRCSCGIEKLVSANSLRCGTSTSCHGNGFKHGGSYTPEYGVWKGIHTRTTNTNFVKYSHYGGRGIKVCKRWKSFANFYADMGPRPSPKHSIERQNNEGDYTPENCRWATAEEQQRNRSDTVIISAQGRSLCLTDWAAELGITINNLKKRLRNGWPEDLAVTLPKGSRLKDVSD